MQVEFFQHNLQSKPVGHGEAFLKNFSLMMSSNFRYQRFEVVSGNLGGKVPVVDDVLSSHEQEIYPTTSLDENCIEFAIQTDWNCFVFDLRQTYLALKLKFVKGRCYESNDTKEVRKEQKQQTKTDKKSGGEGARGSRSSGYSCKKT